MGHTPITHTSGTYIDLDAIVVTGPTPTPTNSPTPTITPTPTNTATPTNTRAPVGVGIYDNPHSTLAYGGNWTVWNVGNAYNGSTNYSNAVGNTAQLTFTGQGVSLLYSKYGGIGVAKIEIDGVVVTNLNQAAAASAFQNRWDSGALINGTHTLKITHLSGTYIDLDAVVVTGPPPTPTNTPTATSTPFGAVSKPFVTILCRFSDSPDITPHPASWFQDKMGSTYPGLDHFWKELSYGKINIGGSRVVGWYNLPHTKQYYIDRFVAPVAEDCATAADPDVYFPDFYGINIILNESLGNYAFADIKTMGFDGQTRDYPTTFTWPTGSGCWPSLVHEMGHALGIWFHSGSSYGTSGNGDDWDLMSEWTENNPDALNPNILCTGRHTIAYHKDVLGWIPSNRKYVVEVGTQATITLERLELPQTNNYLMVQIPISGTNRFYTVEARQPVGYDANRIPGSAVLLHEVDPTR